MTSIVCIVASNSGVAQAPAPPLTSQQLQRLHQVGAWDISYTYHFTHQESGSGAQLTCNTCLYAITGWTYNYSEDDKFLVQYTTDGNHCGNNYGGVVYNPPATMNVTSDQFSKSYEENFSGGCPRDSLVQGPGQETFSDIFSVSGSKLLDSSSGDIYADNFCVDYSVNPPVVRGSSIIYSIPGTLYHSAVGCGDQISTESPGTTHTYEIYIFPYGDNEILTGDTRIREENGLFVIRGNASYQQAASVCNPITGACDSASRVTSNAAFTCSWVIQQHLDSSIIVTRPLQDELWIIGTSDTITWRSADTGAVNIFYSTDSTTTYNTIVNNYSAGSSQQYVWNVPKNILSRKCIIEVQSATDTTHFGESALFKIKGYQLTRLTSDGNYEAFAPGLHGWSFANVDSNLWTPTEFVFYAAQTDSITGRDYPRWFTRRPTNADITDFPSWPLFVQTFGKNSCYFDSTGNEWSGIYRPSAVQYWTGIKGQHQGSCEGMALTSAGAFDEKASLLQSFPQIGNFQNLIELPSNTARRSAINQLMTSQFGKSQKAYENQMVSNTITQNWVDTLKQIFLADQSTDGIDMCMENSDRSAGHVVTPYKIVQDTSEGNVLVSIYVYDNNFPGDTGRYIRLTKGQSSYSWYYSQMWSGTNHLYYEPVSLYLQGAVLPASKAKQFPFTPLASVSNSLNIYTPPGASILMTNAAGDSIGFADSSTFSTIQNGTTIVPRTGYFQPPIGFQVPGGSYIIHMKGFTDTSAYCSVMGDSVIYTYSRSGATSSQSDRLTFANGFTIQNSDSSVKQIYAGGIIVQSDNEKVFGTSNLTLGKNDSIRISTPDRQNVNLLNYGSQKMYTLQLRSASSNGDIEFEHANIPLLGNSLHIIKPGWDNLQGQPVKILIDQGNDGTIDDSMLVDNQTTGVDHGRTTGIPTDFNLYQNYPNPFNPVTTIHYDLPKTSFVTLRMYNVLGQVVATLVNEEKNPGAYSVNWDAGRLSSGVYYYRLEAHQTSGGQAGTFVNTRKLLLVK